MGILETFVSITLIIALLITPIFCAFKNYSFIKHHLVSIPVICALLLVSAYWPHLYADIRLESVGFNFEGMSDLERLEKVSPEDHNEAIYLHRANMGVGWPLKAMIWMIVLLPYPFIIWLVRVCFKATKKWLTCNGT